MKNYKIKINKYTRKHTKLKHKLAFILSLEIIKSSLILGRKCELDYLETLS